MFNSIIKVQVIRGQGLFAVAARFGNHRPFCFGYAPSREAQYQLRNKLESDPAWGF